MNLLGKILVMVILVVTVLLMGFSVAVYSTHQNWKVEAERVSGLLAKARADNEELENRRNRLESQLTAEAEARQQELRKLESERLTLEANNSSLQAQLNELVRQQGTNTQALAATQANNEELSKQNEVLREEIRTNQKQREEAFAAAVAATGELHELQGQYSSALERNRQIVSELADKTALLNESGIDPNTDPDAVVPRVRGVVAATRRSGGSQLIEVTVGADDGLKPGHTIEVFRGDRYLGRVEILKTEPDRAVGRVLRRFQQGQIQEGDHVATKLRIG